MSPLDKDTCARRFNDTPTVSYTCGNDLSGTMEGAGGIGGLLARSSGYSGGNFTTHYYYFCDGNGNITYMLDNSPAKVASYRYDPFGNIISSSGTLASANVYRFSSKEIHVNSGMYYYGYRFYDPNLQRWINRDPIGETGLQTTPIVLAAVPNFWLPSEEQFGGPNLFQFAGNDPIASMDPFGLSYSSRGGKGGYSGRGGGYSNPKNSHSYNCNAPPLPPYVTDCAKRCGLANLPFRGTCAIACIATGPAWLECFLVCNGGATLSQLMCTAICIAGHGG